MHAIAEAAVLYLAEFLFYVVVPALTIWGWMRWLRRPRIWNFASIASFVGFICATASVLLAAFSIVWAHDVGGFAYGDPRLVTIYRLGGLFSGGGFLFSLAGVWVWKPNALRWHAVVCAIGTALFWFASAMGE